jgi:hypothetical protein
LTTMKTKNIIFYLIGILLFSSCEDMFEPADENTKQMEAMAQETNYVYGLLMYAYNRLPYVTTTQTDVATDDAVTNVKGETFREMATGAWRSDNNPMSQWNECKDGIQYANLFLTYVNDVNWAISAPSKQQMFIDRLKGEAFGLRAILYYHLLLAHAGYADDDVLYGVPLLTAPEDGSSEYNQPRATFAACVKQIFDDCDSATALLPDQYKDIDDIGDITKNKQKYLGLGVQVSGYNLVFGNKAKNLVSGKVAQAIKAQTALLAASPAYRNQSGVSSEEAAKICAEVLKDVEFDPEGNIWYKNVDKLASSSSYMPEILWRPDWVNADASQESDNFPPTLFGNGKVNPSQNLVDAFPMRNGYPITDPKSNYDAKDPYANRDPRLADDVIFNGTKFKSVIIITGNYATTTEGKANEDNINFSSTATRTGYYLRKLLRDDAGPSASSSKALQQPHIFPRIRYTELFLAYAEAANDAWGPNSDGGTGIGTAKEIIKKIRERGGIGKDENGDYQGDPYLDECAADGTGVKMRDLIRNERRIELCFENKRFWDIRRWQLPINESVKGMQIDKIDETKDATPDNLKYTLIEVEERKYDTYQNYGPLPYSEVLLWSELRQNKGW